MAFKFTFTERFKMHYKTLTDNEKKQVKSKLRIFAENPMHPYLRTKCLQGTKDLIECSVNMDFG